MQACTASSDFTTTTFLVDPDAGEPNADLKLSLSASSITSYDLGSRGLTVAASGLKAGETTDVVMVLPNGRRVIIATIVADAAGAISKTFTYLTKDAPPATTSSGSRARPAASSAAPSR